VSHHDEVGPHNPGVGPCVAVEHCNPEALAENEALGGVHLHALGEEVLEVTVVVPPDHVHSFDLPQQGFEEHWDLPLLLEGGDGDAVLHVAEEEEPVGAVLPHEGEELPEEPLSLVGDVYPHLRELVLEAEMEVRGEQYPLPGLHEHRWPGC